MSYFPTPPDDNAAPITPGESDSAPTSAARTLRLVNIVLTLLLVLCLGGIVFEVTRQRGAPARPSLRASTVPGAAASPVEAVLPKHIMTMRDLEMAKRSKWQKLCDDMAPKPTPPRPRAAKPG